MSSKHFNRENIDCEIIKKKTSKKITTIFTSTFRIKYVQNVEEKNTNDIVPTDDTFSRSLSRPSLGRILLRDAHCDFRAARNIGNLSVAATIKQRAHLFQVKFDSG